MITTHQNCSLISILCTWKIPALAKPNFSPYSKQLNPVGRILYFPLCKVSLSDLILSPPAHHFPYHCQSIAALTTLLRKSNPKKNSSHNSKSENLLLLEAHKENTKSSWKVYVMTKNMYKFQTFSYKDKLFLKLHFL